MSKCVSYKIHVSSGGVSLPRFHGRVGNNIISISVGCFQIIGFWHGIITFTKSFTGLKEERQLDSQSACNEHDRTFLWSLNQMEGAVACVFNALYPHYFLRVKTCWYTWKNPHVQWKWFISFCYMQRQQCLEWKQEDGNDNRKTKPHVVTLWLPSDIELQNKNSVQVLWAPAK